MHSFAIGQRLKSMASSNRHWPSMFRSNPAACDFQQQQQPDMNNNGSSPSSLLSSPGSSKPSLISSGIEEGTRNPEPKPRWNPRPEQIRILEGIFNAGVVNPPRDEIRRIRLQLQEYGQVGDANVFYWFQNRKSRTKSKLRAPAGSHLQPAACRGPAAALQARACASPPPQAAAAAPAPPLTPPRRLFATSPLAPTSSSSSSSDRSSGSSKSVMKPAALASTEAVASQGIMLPPSTTINLFSPTPSPALSARQLYYHHSHPIPTPTAPLRELITFPGPPPHLRQWPQSQYLPATELGGVLGSHAHTTPAMYPAAVSPGALLGLCNDALGQEDIIDMSCSKGLGQYFNNDTCTADQPSHKTDAVIREDETARLRLLHYGFGVTAAAAPVYAAVSAASDVCTAILPCAAPSNVATSSVELTDQLQVFDLPGLLDAGLIGGAAPPPTATVVVAVAARPDAVRYYSVPASMHLDVKLFGEAAVLLGHTGEQVLVDESGVTAEPLQQGAVYYVLVNN